jgi:Fe-S-cluster containining protein
VRRIPLPVLQLERPTVECTDCGRCCTYVGVGVNPPNSPRHATDVLWYLYHEGVYVYVDGEGEWSVHFEARCRNLGPDLRCGVYVDRPHICRTFDNRTCEVNDPVQDSLTFREPAEFLAWLREKKPRLLAKIEKGFVPKALRPREVATPRTARVARRRAVARKARI